MKHLSSGWKRRVGFALSRCFIVLSLGLFFGLRPAISEDGNDWISTMRSLEKVLSNLMASQVQGADAQLGAQLKELSRLTQKLSKQEKLSPDSDPSVQIFSKMFSSYAQQASVAFSRGNREYARGLVNGVSTYCFACHTRTTQAGKVGAKTLGGNLGFPLGSQFEKFTPFQKGRYWVATRQFEKGADELEKVIADSSFASTQLLDWEKAVRMGIALSVRTLADPDRALRMVARAEAESHSALFFRENAAVWKEALLSWKQEGVRRPETEEGYRAEWLRLMTQARTRGRYPLDRSADIDWLRATQVLHDYLSKFSRGQYVAEAYMSLGVSYEALRGLQLEQLPEVYFESCILAQPQSALARSCYSRLEEGVHISYSGSAGTHLPQEVKSRLAQLRKLSQEAAEQAPGAGKRTVQP
jgi:hypothetical protein